MLKQRMGVYTGIDPTGPSLHIGHLVTLMPLYWMYTHGFGAYVLLGGSTAKIGDPTGKSQDRPFVTPSQLVQNMTSIHYQLTALWRAAERKALQPYGLKRDWAWSRGLVNNSAWWNKEPLMEVFRLIGRHTRIGPLLSRDNVKTRLNDGSGMSFSEFAYPVMQAWDWWKLYTQRNVQMQIGGSDQYSNILFGAQTVKKCIENAPEHLGQIPDADMIGLTVPLLTDSSGQKFGKSEGNAVWLDPFRTSSFELYGYFVRRADDEVEKLLKLLTFLPLETIRSVIEEHARDPPKRVAHHLLAFEVVDMVHGPLAAKQAQIEHRQMYGRDAGTQAASSASPGSVPQSSEQYHRPIDMAIHVPYTPRIDIKLPKLLLKASLPTIVHAAELAGSRGEADRLIKGGGLYIGASPGQKPSEQQGMLTNQLAFTPLRTWETGYTETYLIGGNLMLLRKGKHTIRCIEFLDDKEWQELGIMYRGQPNTGRLRRGLVLVKQLESLLEADGADPQLKNRVNAARRFLERHPSKSQPFTSYKPKDSKPRPDTEDRKPEEPYTQDLPAEDLEGVEKVDVLVRKLEELDIHVHPTTTPQYPRPEVWGGRRRLRRAEPNVSGNDDDFFDMGGILGTEEDDNGDQNGGQ